MNLRVRYSRALIAFSLGVLALTLSLSTAALAAEPSAADRATARALAREGFEALKNNDYATAEDRFRRADQLVHAPTLVVDHARALVGLGRLVEAHERYSLVLREGVSPNAAWPWKRAHADAQKEIEDIKKRLAWLTINVKGPSEPEVSVDDKPIPPAAIGVRRATDPGERKVVAGGVGFYPKEQSVVLEEGDEQAIDFELEPMPQEEVEQAQPQAAPVEQPRPVVEAERDNTLAWVALGIGGVGLATWGVTGVMFLQEKSKLDEKCENDECPEEQVESRDRYRTLGTISAVAFGVGLAGAAAGVTLLLLNSDSEAGAADAATVTPYVAGNSVGVVGRF